MRCCTISPRKPGKRCRNGHQNPDQRRKHNTCDGDCFERDSDRVGLAHVYMNLADVGNQLKPVDDDCGKQEGGDRKAC